MNKNEKWIIDPENDMTAALYFIESAALLNCFDEGTLSSDQHVLTKIEARSIIGRLLNKALIVLGDDELVDLFKSFNTDEQNNNHDAHTKLLLNLINNEFDQMKKGV